MTRTKPYPVHLVTKEDKVTAAIDRRYQHLDDHVPSHFRPKRSKSAIGRKTEPDVQDWPPMAIVLSKPVNAVRTFAVM